MYEKASATGTVVGKNSSRCKRVTPRSSTQRMHLTRGCRKANHASLETILAPTSVGSVDLSLTVPRSLGGAHSRRPSPPSITSSPAQIIVRSWFALPSHPLQCSAALLRSSRRPRRSHHTHRVCYSLDATRNISIKHILSPFRPLSTPPAWQNIRGLISRHLRPATTL